MTSIEDVEVFLGAELYLPLSRELDPDWVNLYEAVSEVSFNVQSSFVTVGQVSNYLLKHPEYDPNLVKAIQGWKSKFNFELYSIEACPSRFVGSERIFLRGGNKRSIYYATCLIAGEKYRPIRICHWLDFFDRYDTRDHKIKCVCQND